MMKTAVQDVASIVRDWTPEERRMALGIIIGDTFAENGEQLFSVADENELSLALIQPFRFRVEPSNLDESTPYGREMLRRSATLDDAIPLEELMEQWDNEQKESVFSPRVIETQISDNSGRWFDMNGARKWDEELVLNPDGTKISKATGIAWKHETLCLTRCGTFVMHHRDLHDYPTDRYFVCDQEKAMQWLAENGHDVSLQRIEEAKQIRRLEI
jgi:hypothetical protein